MDDLIIRGCEMEANISSNRLSIRINNHYIENDEFIRVMSNIESQSYRFSISINPELTYHSCSTYKYTFKKFPGNYNSWYGSFIISKHTIFTDPCGRTLPLSTLRDRNFSFIPLFHIKALSFGTVAYLQFKLLRVEVTHILGNVNKQIQHYYHPD